VSQNQGNAAIHGDMELATFEALKEVFPRLDALVLNGIGEPLLNHHLEMFISQAKKNMSGQGWIGFQTNGNLLSNLRALALVDAGLDRICLTMGGTSLSACEATRTGGQLVDLDLAFSAIVSSKAICSRPDLQVGVEFIIAADNLGELPGAISWAASRGATFAIVSGLNSPAEALPGQCSFDAGMDEALDHLNVWKSKADEAGVNIDRYFELLWKHGRTSEEQRIVNFVESMRSIASYRGLQLGQNRSSGMENTFSEEVDQAFERARIVAREVGLDLRLPRESGHACSSSASSEEGAAFIAWDGRMYPGYHLRNRFRSCSNGWLHPAQPAVFGNVLKRGVLDIWNSAEFRSYRRNLLQNDEPHCFGCDSSGQNGVGSDDFGQAVHANSEPCGGCRRSSAAFRCME
jgi:putative metalloenzyme radical SAM/SPASM domain maturase